MTAIIGVMSDTHGLLRQEAINLLQGSEIIVHAGDIGHPDVLDKLTRIAPVFAVKGNVDKGPWSNLFPETEFIDHLGCMIYSLHNLSDLDQDPTAAGIHVVVSGHSHRSEKKDTIRCCT